MSDAMNIAAAGLNQSVARFNSDAERVVKATTSGSGQEGDPTDAIVAQKVDETAFKASAAVFNAANQMFGTLLDLTV